MVGQSAVFRPLKRVTLAFTDFETTGAIGERDHRFRTLVETSRARKWMEIDCAENAGRAKADRKSPY